MSVLLLAVLLAGPVEDHVALGLQLIQEGDFEQARAELDAAEQALSSSQEVVLGGTVASIHFYRGVVEYHDGDRDTATLDHWRKALVADPNYRFDRALVKDPDMADLFEALRSEVGQRPQEASGLQADDPRVYIDGRIMHDYDLVFHGSHLVQVLCDDGTLHGAVLDIPPAPVYASYCPGYTAPLVVTEAPVPSSGFPSSGFPVGGTLVMGGGGLLLAAGLALNFAVVAPTFQQVEQARTYPQLHDRASADAFSRRFNRSRLATMGLMGAGAVTLGAGAAWTVRF